MKLFNTKTNQLETFQSINPGKVMMYVCGPTVYNYAHLGNARPLVVFDTLKNVLVANGYEVKYVSNYTDIDDKIIAQAQAEGILETEITDKYIKAYETLMENLNVYSVDQRIKVTESIHLIIEFIQMLMDKDLAYQVGRNVYFRVNKIKRYGELSKQTLEDLVVGSRVDENQDKEYPFDFVLWKNTNDEGIKWDSPWGKGRPGWHTECVVMIHEAFKTSTIDIHGGGADLKFPHHENEQAQNIGCSGHDLANYWIHNAMLMVENEKMSKSLGNVALAQDVIDQLGSNVTRWILVSNHYRQMINLTDQTIEAAKKEVEKLELALNQAHFQLQLSTSNTDEFDEESYRLFLDHMNDDLNTPNAMMIVFDTVKKLNQSLRLKEKDILLIGKLFNSLIKMSNLLGIKFDFKIFTDEDKDIILKWNQAKFEKNFELADSLRANLLSRGIKL